MSTAQNVWTIEYPDSGFSFIAKCGFQYLHTSQPGPYVAIKINSGQSIYIYNQFQNGVYKGNGLEISFRGEKLETCNYINIIMSIKSTNRSVLTYSICNIFETSNGFAHDASGLLGFQGFRRWISFRHNQPFSFIFNNSQKVTPISYADYRYLYYFGKQDPVDNTTTFQSKGIAMTWADREISPGEVQEIRYSFGIDDYVTGYIIDIKTKTKKSYEPGSVISLNVHIVGNFYGDHLELSRIIDSSTLKIVINEADTGNHFNLDDEFELPLQIGYHKIKYIARNNQSIEDDKVFEILVNNQPNITIFPEFFTVYNPDEKVSLNVSVFDDANVNIYLVIDGNTIISDLVECNSKIVSKIYDFSIPLGEIGSSHVMSIYCVDNYNIQSNKITQTFTLQITKPPEVKVADNITYLFRPRSTVEIFGSIKNFDESKRTCLNSAIDNDYYENHPCNFFGNSWTSFSFNRTIPNIKRGIYILNIICTDNYQRPYTTFTHAFAVVQERQCTECYCNYYERIQDLINAINMAILLE